MWRIYDALLLLLRESNPTVAAELVEIHEAGEFVGPNPKYMERTSNE